MGRLPEDEYLCVKIRLKGILYALRKISYNLKQFNFNLTPKKKERYKPSHQNIGKSAGPGPINCQTSSSYRY